MGELTVRRNRASAPVPYVGTGKTEKQSGKAPSQKAAGSAAFTVSETLRRLLVRVDQAAGHIRESRRTLQTGESVLDEVQDSLERLAQLAQRSASGEEPDRAALQEQLEQLRADIHRMITGAVVDGTPLFLDEDMDLESGAEGLQSAAPGDPSPGQAAVQELPRWLVQGMGQNALTPRQLLAALGLDETAGAEEVLAVLAETSLESDPAAGQLAALYLGAVIAGSSDPERALEGLGQLLERVARGVSPDEAVQTLTRGEFSSLIDFQEQFSGGTAPGLQAFLTELLSAEEGTLFPEGTSLLALLARVEEAELEVMLRLLNAMLDPGDILELLDAGGAEGAEGTPAPSAAFSTLLLGNVQVIGRDLSGVSLDDSTGTLIIHAASDVTVCGTGQGPQAIHITGEGTVTLQQAEVSTLTVTSAAHIHGRGESTLAEVLLDKGAQLTLSGGLLRIGTLQGDRSNLLRLAGGAVAVGAEGQGMGTLAVPVIVEGPVSLAAQAASVRTPEGKALEPFDVVWRTLLPGWSSVTALSLDGKQTRMALELSAPMRLWLDRGDPSHGAPVCAMELRGKDGFGRTKSRYAYLHWSQMMGMFQEINIYPNPFSVTGGEPERDWVYEEATCTLRILSNQVTAVSGGTGTDANQTPFSGRLALADGIGPMELTLDGVVCRVSAGRAFYLGEGNDVTLLLRSGSRNRFQSGPGYAGISLGEGTSLSIDRGETSGSRLPDGELSAFGGTGGAGIGRDRGGGRDRSSQIRIRGGVITAEGKGGGAGIGAALGAALGDISIRGGLISAAAAQHAAAIGAGVQGECGNIWITGTARIVKASGGDPGADIGACLFGACGEVQVSGAADIGRAKLRRYAGIRLSVGEDTVTLPQFCLSARVLQLDGMDLSTREGAQAAEVTLRADRYWVAQLQRTYGVLYSRLEQSIRSLSDVQPYLSPLQLPVRNAAEAGALLEDMRRSILLQSGRTIHTHGISETEHVRQLLE